MDDDQQFCLRWNNHQSTLVSVFDNLLENGTLVDCTLFAEGKFLKAHKVVLSACSPYFESLLTQQYDKHPIFILKDVKFQELKAMMDYMYRGEVNISQDQLAALLKAAESLQIKGLSDSRSKGESEQRKAAPPAAKSPPPAPAPTIPRVQGLTIEQRKTPKLSATADVIEDSRSREGSQSPVPRKRKKPRRRSSQEGLTDNHDASSSSESHSNQAAPAQNIPATLPATPLASTSKIATDVPEPIETKPEPVTRQIKSSSLPPSSVEIAPQVPIKEKLETHSELILEPKSEYIEEEMNEDSVEDLTLDDDDVSQMEHDMDHARPGPSHGSTDNSQGFGGWHMAGNQNQDEVFLAAQEAVGAHRDSQEGELEEIEEEVVITTEMSPEEPTVKEEIVPKPSGSKLIKIIRVEDVHDAVGDLKKELSTHLTFDNVKAINKKIINRELSLKKVTVKPSTFVLRSPDPTVKKYYRKRSITAARMQKFLAMTAADCKDAQVKQPTCLAPVLKTPRDTLRCVKCDVLFDPTKKEEHLKVCRNTKISVKSYGCMFCNFKSSSHEETANHVKNNHK